MADKNADLLAKLAELHHAGILSDDVVAAAKAKVLSDAQSSVAAKRDAPECRPGSKKYVLTIDEGTTSSRCILFDHHGHPAFTSQKEFTQIYPQPGWCEHNPMEILDVVKATMAEVLMKADATKEDIAAIGITNQRETTVAWDSKTGKPLANAIVWLDLRTADIVENLIKNGGKDKFRETTGLPVATYFSAVKMRWLIENVPAVKAAVDAGTCRFGTIDAWLTYNLTGASDGGVFVTDVSNAARYMLMDLATTSWSESVCKEMGIPVACLPQIRSNSEVLGEVAHGPLAGVPITCSLGDQHAALLGQACLEVGDVKSTYGTGCFILMNTGEKPIPSKAGLLTTVGWKLGKDAPTTYALEGSVAVAGRGIQWLRDNLKLIHAAPQVGPLAAEVKDCGGVTFVPAFSGLFAPHWRSDARAIICGMTLHTNFAHIARAILEGIAFQACDVITAMEKDANSKLGSVKVDGGMTMSDQAMQIQADLLGKPLFRARMPEATALGCAFAAGLAVGFWKDVNHIRALLEAGGGAVRFQAAMEEEAREKAHRRWQDAVKRCLNLADL
eukprot:TRINITY_DN24191_c0_g3_i1.p1 TRINITY_DN24191_c0_g3~~TRINITY_DN24191_c0_g3_i1.p1  ORF type:complete len:558 (+),score=131.08 TRINITY_DN24191_c0_g3_i1:78-1751(+)